jgi:hypothetical protein
MPTASDLVTDLPADFEVFGQAVATSLQDLLGGTTGQVLAKASNTNMDFTWVAQDDSNAIQNAIVDAKGDLIGATAADTPARLAVGTNGQVLTADSTAATGLAWASSSPLTTKGDLYTYSTTNARLAIGADYGFLQANSGATTGNEWNATAWTAYTPAISSNGGTITTATAAGYWIRIGKLCVVRSSWAVTTNGTGSLSLNLSLPFTGAAAGIGSTGVGREYAVTGKELQIEIGSGDTVMRFRNYDNSYPAGNSYQGTGTICYEVA